MPRDPQGGSLLHARRNRDLEFIFFFDFTTTTAGIAGLINEDTLAMTNRANSDLLKTDGALFLGFLASSDLLASAIAGFTLAWRSTRFGARTMTGRTGHRPGKVHGFFTAGIHGLQGNCQSYLQITALNGSAWAPVASKKISKQATAKIKSHVAENVTEIDTGKQILGREAGDTGKTTRIIIRMGLVNVGMKMGARFAPDMEGVDFDVLTEAVRSGASGKVMDVVDEEEGERVEIFVE